MPRQSCGSKSPFRESIALVRRAAIESAPEPARAIRRGTVRERLRRYPTARHLLELVVADGGSRAKALLRIAGLQHLPLRRGMAPHARIAVGLQLEPDRERVTLRRVALHQALHTLALPEHVLHVVSDLVGDHVRLREVSGRSEAPGQLPVEAQIDVNALVGRTVEGSHLRAGFAAAGSRLVPEEHELRLPVPVDPRAPELLRIVEGPHRHALEGLLGGLPLGDLLARRLSGRARAT